jgi:hypothetical protein
MKFRIQDAYGNSETIEIQGTPKGIPKGFIVDKDTVVLSLSSNRLVMLSDHNKHRPFNFGETE